MRSAPDLSAERLTTIPDGTRVEILATEPETLTISGREGHWTRVRHEEHSGWVFGGFLKISSHAHASVVPDSQSGAESGRSLSRSDIAELVTIRNECQSFLEYSEPEADEKIEAWKDRLERIQRSQPLQATFYREVDDRVNNDHYPRYYLSAVDARIAPTHMNTVKVLESNTQNSSGDATIPNVDLPREYSHLIGIATVRLEWELQISHEFDSESGENSQTCVLFDNIWIDALEATQYRLNSDETLAWHPVVGENIK